MASDSRRSGEIQVAYRISCIGSMLCSDFVMGIGVFSVMTLLNDLESDTRGFFLILFKKDSILQDDSRSGR